MVQTVPHFVNHWRECTLVTVKEEVSVWCRVVEIQPQTVQRAFLDGILKQTAMSVSFEVKIQQQIARRVFLISPVKSVTQKVKRSIYNWRILAYHDDIISLHPGGGGAEPDVALLAGAVGGAGGILIIFLLVLCAVIMFVMKVKKKGRYYSKKSKSIVLKSHRSPL